MAGWGSVVRSNGDVPWRLHVYDMQMNVVGNGALLVHNGHEP